MAHVITIPDFLNNRDHDYVWYDYIRGDKPSASINKGACYATCMSFLPECNFTLRPSDGKSLLPFDVFKKYIELCKENGIVNKDVSVDGSEGNNRLLIPKGHNRHKVYSTLCCYRWSENQPGVAYATVKALEQYPEIDFFQAFHYGCARRAYWLIHSFHYILAEKSTYNTGLGNNGLLYVPNSMILAHAFRNEKKNNKTLVENMSNSGYTTDAINSLMIGLKFPDCKDANSKKYKIKDLEEILSPKLTKLYREPISESLVEKTILEL